MLPWCPERYQGMTKTGPMGLLVLALATPARADQVLDLSGTLAAEQGTYTALPFEVPAGVGELEVQHQGLEARNTLDFGLLAPDGFRCWTGSSTEPSITGARAASRGCATGPLTPGAWRVIIGAAWLEVAPAPYRLVVALRDQPTLLAQPGRAPYASAGVLDPAARWYAGDFHVHSNQSNDGQASLDELAAFGSQRGLDFVALTDHNNAAQLELIVDAQARHPDFLFLPGEEVTTYGGHANALGLTAWVSHLVGLDGRTIEQVATDVHAQGALLSLNHPTLDVGELCLGCAWEHALEAAQVDAVEVCSSDIAGTWPVLGDSAIELWDGLCAQGRHVAALGGSDAHWLPAEPGGVEIQPGTPTTLVFAEGLGVAPLLEGIRAGRTVVKLRGPGGPMIELSSQPPPAGDTVTGSARLTALVRGGQGQVLRWVRGGRVSEERAIDAEPFLAELQVEAPEQGELRVRVEVRDGQGMPLALTSHLWIAPDEEEAGGGCASAGPGAVSLTAFICLLPWRLRRGRKEETP